MTVLLPLAGFAAGLGLGLVLWRLDTRREIHARQRRRRELAEPQKHLALPPAPPLPDRLFYHGQILRVVCRRRHRP